MRIRGKIIRAVLCCVVYESCAQWYAYTYEQFLKMSACLGFGVVFVHLFRFSILCVFLVSFRLFSSCVVCFCCLWFSFFSSISRDWLGRTSLKWAIFTARRSYASAVLGVVILSVHPSVCHMHALWLIQRTYWRYFNTTWKGNPSSFLPPNSGWWATSPSTFNGRSKWPTPFKNRSLRQIYSVTSQQ